MAGSFDNYQVLYSLGPPVAPIRLGQLLVDEAVAGTGALKICTNLSPVTYTAVAGGGGLPPDADYGDITVTGVGTIWTIDNDAVTFAKFQNINDARLLGRSAGSAGDMMEITVGAGLSLAAGALTSTVTAPVGANPTALVGLAAVNGAAATFMRSDGAPALDQGIAPTWTSTHVFTGTSIQMSNVSPSFYMTETGATADEGWWRLIADADALTLATRTDANGLGKTLFSITRTGTALETFTLGNLTDTGAFSLLSASGSPLTINGTIDSAYTLGIDNDSNGIANAARLSISAGDSNGALFVSGSGRTSVIVTSGPVGAQMTLRTLGNYPLVFATSNTFRFMIDGDGSWTDSAASTGAAGNVWTSNGAAASPTWQAAGAGSVTITRVVVTLPYPAKRSHVVNVVDAAMAATNKIILSVDGAEETQTNASDSIDLLTMSANPNAGSFDLQMNFLSPTAGPVSINYIRAA